MIQISSLSKHFGPQSLFENITWQLDRFQRTALVGHNGAGKSTLLKIIAGLVEADAGSVILPKGLSLGYLPQEITGMASLPALDYVMSGREDILKLEAEIAELEAQIGGKEGDKLVENLGLKQEQFNHLGGYSLKAQAQSIMAALGFEPNEFDKACAEFSGGWQMRILLAKLLLAKPDLLLLDEPTNHLDMTSVAWLESFLANYPGTLIIVSHDRVFLNRVIQGVAALDANGLMLYPGNYDHYLELREALEEQLKKNAEQQRQSIAEKEAFIERFRYKASKAKQVQSRIKQLEKLEDIQLLQRRKKLHFHFPNAERTPKILLELNGVSKAYGDKIVYQGLDFRIYRGDKIALIAPNGAGKSTLIKILSGTLDFEGQRLLSDNVHLAHFAQHQVDALDFKKTLLAEASEGLPLSFSITQVRAALGAMLFQADDIEKPVSVLSGGEKNKLALVKILLRAPNLLLLDEPTNHLDLDSREALENALADFSGSMVVISHDRWFIEKVCNKIVSIQNGQLEVFEGSYSAYEAFLEARKRDAAGPHPDEARAEANAQNKKRKRVEQAERREAYKKATQREQRALDEAEGALHALEARKAEIEASLSEPELYRDPQQLKALSIEKNQLECQIESAFEAWALAQESLDRAIARFEAQD